MGMFHKVAQSTALIILLVVGCDNISTGSRKDIPIGGPPPPPPGTAPTVTLAVPEYARCGIATPIVITGTDFIGTTSVTLGGFPLVFTNVTATTIDATVPAGLVAGGYPIIVTTPAGNSTANTITFFIAGKDHVQISEVCYHTGHEFIEIHNPYIIPQDISDYYLTDATDTNMSDFYWKITDPAQSGDAWSGQGTDFLVKFPNPTILVPGQRIVVHVGDAAPASGTYFTQYGRAPDYEIRFSSVDDLDGIIDMIAAPAVSPRSIGSGTLGLTNAPTGECVILFQWIPPDTGVFDVDYFIYGGGASGANPKTVDKTSATVQGPSGPEMPYGPDTPVGLQADITTALDNSHSVPASYQRFDLCEGAEGFQNLVFNGIFAHDETSENFNLTFDATMLSSPGLPFPAAPYPGETNVSLTPSITYEFYRNLQSSQPITNAEFKLEQPLGVDVPAAVTGWPNPNNIALLTPAAPLLPNTTYTVRLVSNASAGFIIREDAIPYFSADFLWTFTTGP